MNYLILTGVGFVETFIRKFFAVIDGMIYGLFGLLIKAYFKISDIDLLTPALQAMKTRLYIFVAIFMIFRVTISLLQAMVNPDIANDKKNGVGNLVSRVAVSLVLLVAVPVLMDNVLFGSTNGVSNQQIIASIIPKIILGTGGAGMADEGNQDNIGQHIASATYNAFFTIDEECGEGEEYKLDGMKVSSMTGHVDDKCENEHKDKFYKYEYSYFISTICGAIMIIMIIGYSLDVVTRILKLQILQVLAPIPIVAYIDPGKGKDTLFSTWLKTLVSTYCDFFIKLASLYFVIFIMLLFIQNLDNFIAADNAIEKGYLFVIVILGLLLALKQLPEFISSLFGIKSQGFGAGLGTFLGAAAGFTTGGLAGMVKGGLDGAADGGKNALGAWNKGRDAGKKTDTGKDREKQRQMNREQRRNERLSARYGLNMNKKNKKDELGIADDELARAQHNYDMAKANGGEYTWKDEDGNEQSISAEAAYKNLQDAKKKQGDAQKAYDQAKKYADDPRKAIADRAASTRTGAAVRYHARQAAQGVARGVNRTGEYVADTRVGRAVDGAVEFVSNSSVGQFVDNGVQTVRNGIRREGSRIDNEQMNAANPHRVARDERRYNNNRNTNNNNGGGNN